MAFTLRILFDGLCVFVPNTNEKKGVRVLVIDARAPGVASNGDGQVSHVPSVRFPLADLAPEAKQPSHRIEYSSQDPIPRGQWILNGDDLQIRAGGQPLPDRPLEVLRRHPTRDFDLIPSMKMIYPETNGVAVRDECLSADLERLSDAGLVGRLRLQAGTLGVWDGADGRYVSSDEYMFTGNPTLHRQRIASRTFFETEVEADEVEIFSRQRGHGLTFRPADGHLVEILIENQPPADLMSAKPGDPDVDWDFELNYLIAKDAPKPLRLPIRAAAAWSKLQEEARRAEVPGLAAGHSEKPCSPTTFEPNQEAAGQGTNCPPAAYADSTEASANNRPACPGTEYTPSAEAGRPVHCPPTAYEPSAEAGVSNPKCPPTTFDPSTEAILHSPLCSPATFDPSAEATVHSPLCPPATFAPSREANVGNPQCPGTTFAPSAEAAFNSQCSPATYAPSEEAAVSNPRCPPTTFDPSREANARGGTCSPVIYPPNEEASVYDRTLCPPATFAPSEEATLNGPVICPGSVFFPSREAEGEKGVGCSPVTFGPSAEANGRGINCFPVIYAPSEEAGFYERIMCPAVTFRSSREAGLTDTLCPPLQFPPHPGA